MVFNEMKTHTVCYWGKQDPSHTAVLTAKGDLIFYWGKKEAPSFLLKGAEVTSETESHISVEIEGREGFVDLEGIGKYTWSQDESNFTITDTRGRSLNCSPSGDVFEETFTTHERSRVDQEIKREREKQKMERRRGLVFWVGAFACGVAYLLSKV